MKFIQKNPRVDRKIKENQQKLQEQRALNLWNGQVHGRPHLSPGIHVKAGTHLFNPGPQQGERIHRVSLKEAIGGRNERLYIGDGPEERSELQRF